MTLFNGIILKSIPPELQVIAITFLPFLELRASIPYGILVLKMNWTSVFFITLIANIILGIIVYFFLDKFVHLIVKIKTLQRIYNFYVIRTQKKIQKYVEKYGEFAVAVFIGIPFPGTGVYAGAFGAYLINLGYKRFIIANILGVLIAGIIVTFVTLTGASAFNFFIKTI